MSNNEWTKCDDSLPERDGVYLGWHAEANEDQVWPALFEDGRWFHASGEGHASVTHWQPMPSAPSL